jgi:two-component system phosphate regulon sensor histidine kinase PhoR
MKRPIFLRVFLGFSAVILLSLLAFALFSLRISQAGSREGLQKGLERTAEAAGVAALPLAASGRSAPLDALAHDIGGKSHARITIIDPRGVVLADSEQDPAAMENHAGRPEVAVALAGKTGAAVRFSSTLGKDMLYVAVPLALPDGATAVARASAPRTELDAAGSQFSKAIALFALALLAASLVTALLLSRSILRPLAELSQAVGRIAGGDFSARIYLPRKDEVTDLAASFNDMGVKVQGLFDEVTRRTRELDGIFSSVTQGIALIDREGLILRANRAFGEIVGAPEAQGKRVWEVVREARLIELIDRARLHGPSPAQEIEIADRSYLFTAARMGESGELVTVLHDISEPRRLEELKRDFVTNASHELRTPLTAVRGYLELLQADFTGEKARWLEAIRRNTDRMTAIVEDLLRLSRLEGSQPDFSPGPADLAQLVRQAAEAFGRRAEEKGLSLAVSLPDDLPRIQADPFLLEQMLVNLIDNAVKYTETGEIRVSCLREGDGVAIEVADTGIGIPPEHVPRIFERFYVVDKSRSRKLGGTGLGLSLVKHIVGLHGGTIDVESAPGEGTRFVVRLPIDAARAS